MAKKIISGENWNIDYFNFLSVYVCPSVFALFKVNRDLSYKQNFELFLKMINLPLSKKEMEWTMLVSLYAHDLAVFRQNVCLVENIMKGSFINLTSYNFKSKLMDIRKKVTIEGGDDLTNYNFIKLIRNTFAHNNELEEKPQLTFFEDPNEGYIKFKIEKPDQNIKIIMGPEDMDELCNAMVENVNSLYIPGSALGVRTKRLKNSLLGGYFDAKKINRYMHDVKSDTEFGDLVIDENQEKAITNYFKAGQIFKNEFYMLQKCKDKTLGISLTNPSLITTVFPRTNNAITIATQNLLQINAIYGEIKKDPNTTLNDIVEKFYAYSASKDLDEQDFGLISSYFLTSKYSKFLETATALTTVLSNRDTDDFEEEFKNFFEPGSFHHVRNAMVHGTYFFDFDNNICIYDGQKKLKFITSFNHLEVLAKTQEIAKKRWKETFKIKIKNFCDFDFNELE